MKSLKVLAITIFMLAGYSYNPTAHAATNNDCDFIQNIGNAIAKQIEGRMNSQVAGRNFAINRQHKLAVEGIHEVNFKGCEISSTMSFKLNYSRHGNSHGKAILQAKVSSFDADRVCLGDVKLNGKSIMEFGIDAKLYKTLANEALHENQCFSFK